MKDASAAHPEYVFELDTSGELISHFDIDRLHQLIPNLLNNAAQYSAKKHLTFCARGDPNTEDTQVTRLGPVIPVVLHSVNSQRMTSSLVGLMMF